MLAGRRLIQVMLLLSCPHFLTGCELLDRMTESSGAPPLSGPEAPPVTDEVSMPKRTPNRGMLLRTGSMQLGPGVGKNLWGWQGEGFGGF